MLQFNYVTSSSLNVLIKCFISTLLGHVSSVPELRGAGAAGATVVMPLYAGLWELHV